MNPLLRESEGSDLNHPSPHGYHNSTLMNKTNAKILCLKSCNDKTECNNNKLTISHFSNMFSLLCSKCNPL